MTDERQTYTVEQAAEILGIGRNSAYKAVWRGEILTIWTAGTDPVAQHTARHETASG